MLELGDNVVAQTHDGELEGRIVGRSRGASMLYDVKTQYEILVNVPEKNVQPAASAAKPTPLTAPSTKNVSQSPREIHRATSDETKQAASGSQDCS